MKFTIVTLCLTLALGLVGCSAPPAETGTNAPAAKNADGSPKVAEVTCEQCAKVVPVGDAVEHGSSYICKACEATHNH